MPLPITGPWNALRATAVATLCLAAPLNAMTPTLSKETRAFVSVDLPLVAITHVSVVDGNGRPAKGDQTVVLQDGRTLRRLRRPA